MKEHCFPPPHPPTTHPPIAALLLQHLICLFPFDRAACIDISVCPNDDLKAFRSSLDFHWKELFSKAGHRLGPGYTQVLQPFQGLIMLKVKHSRCTSGENSCLEIGGLNQPPQINENRNSHRTRDKPVLKWMHVYHNMFALWAIWFRAQCWCALISILKSSAKTFNRVKWKKAALLPQPKNKHHTASAITNWSLCARPVCNCTPMTTFGVIWSEYLLCLTASDVSNHLLMTMKPNERGHSPETERQGDRVLDQLEVWCMHMKVTLFYTYTGITVIYMGREDSCSTTSLIGTTVRIESAEFNKDKDKHHVSCIIRAFRTDIKGWRRIWTLALCCQHTGTKAFIIELRPHYQESLSHL